MVHQVHVLRLERLEVGVLARIAVAPGVRRPHVPVHAAADAAEFAEEARAATVHGCHARRRAIVVAVDGVARLLDPGRHVARRPALAVLPAQIAALVVAPARRTVHEARPVIPPRPEERVARLDGAGLAPRLVVRNPHHDRRDVVEMVDHLLELAAVEAVARLQVSPARRHVLHDQDAEPVAKRIVAARFDLDVLAHHVEAGILQQLDVPGHRLFRRRREKPVRPPALVERAEDVAVRVVQPEAQDALRVGRHVELAHAEVAPDAVRAAGRREVVEVRLLRAPELESLGHPDAGLAVRVRHGAQLPDAHLDRHRGATGAGDVKREAHRPRVDVGRHAVAGDVGLGHLLQPDRPVKPRDARVQAAVRLGVLLADAAEAGICRVPHHHQKLVRPFAHESGDVVRERQKAALVGKPRLAPVDEHLRAEIGLLEPKEKPAARARRRFERATVPQDLRRIQQPPHARKGRFQRERHEDLSVPLRRNRLRAFRHGVIPESVQVRPALAHHLRARILPPRVLRRHLFAPFGHERRRSRRVTPVRPFRACARHVRKQSGRQRKRAASETLRFRHLNCSLRFN